MRWTLVLALAGCGEAIPVRHAFFGDTHVHTYLSLDANLQGTRATPAEMSPI